MFVIRKIDSIEKTENYSFMHEAKQNTYTLLWGTILISLLLFISFCIWILAGSLIHWGGFYIITTALIGTIIFIYAYISTLN